MSANAHAIIHPDAQIGKGVIIEPFVTVEADVVIGDGTWVGSQACIKSGTRIGANCKIFQGAIVGGDPQDLKFTDEKTYLEISDNVTIREYCTINRGTRATGVRRSRRAPLLWHTPMSPMTAL